MAYARDFMVKHLPFWEMEPCDELLSSASTYAGENNTVTGQVFAKENEVYAIYLPVAENTGSLALDVAQGTFRLRWFNPRTGAFSGGEVRLQGSRAVALGMPPADPSEDWVALLTREESSL
jgi:hypothetical protein